MFQVLQHDKMSNCEQFEHNLVVVTQRNDFLWILRTKIRNARIAPKICAVAIFFHALPPLI